ncbi:hypothetical protein QTJ16_005372 [Diplocarpon rosae]|uniref:Ras-GAP domain-containing protein n=1 Tax=Diplocarpon rosae TaxID=946125 RepID=A0AAD9SXM4_9HELO|nr:hypothetical protein QTJ16_005372 [Diplocarpon rosae]
MSNILPKGMDGRSYNGSHGKDGALQEWQRNATESLAKSLERPSDPYTSQRVRSAMHSSIRPVTPDILDEARDVSFGIGPVQLSPRSIQGGEKSRDRRQGLVFQDPHIMDAFEAGSAGRSGPPVSLRSRPRNFTINEPPHQVITSNSASEIRRRVGSMHGTVFSPFHDVQLHTETSSSLGFPLISTQPLHLQRSNSNKGGRRLVKKISRPTSPLASMGDVPSVDSLPFPVATGDAKKFLMLMKTLCGRMRGEVEYRSVENGPWHRGICYIDDAKGALLCEGDDRSPFHLAVISDLRGCRVKPIAPPERPIRCLELSNNASGIEIHLMPMVKTEYDLWLAALLCWQQIRTTPLPASPLRSPTPSLIEKWPPTQRRDSSVSSSQRGGNIIKVAKLLLWDKGPSSSPAGIVRRPSTRELRSSNRSGWRKVSCILQDNGEFKILTENDITLLSVIQLSQLSRCAIQRLERSVLDEDHCIAIFPQYTSTSTQLSILRPVYIALDSRLTHEVWFCLLRAFTIPEIYGPGSSNTENDEDLGVSQPLPSTNDMFRIEKSISLRLIEAKIRKTATKTEMSQPGRSVKAPESDPSVGDYFVEVILDGEVRARTETRNETKNPFWREACDFLDLPAHLPSLSIVLKKADHAMVSAHGFLSSSSVHMTSPPAEITCGSVELPMDKLDRGKDNEAWWPILDDQQARIGEMFLRVRHDELVVLLAKDYQPISELLHNFSSGLTVQIAQAVPTNLKTLAEILMNIFQVSGHAGEWLMALIEDEIDGLGKEQPNRRLRWSRRLGSNESFSSISEREQMLRDVGKSLQGEANLLFRGNSLFTQALDFYMRRVGKEYLEEVLSDKIMEINTMNPDCEVDPSRILHAEDLNKNWTLLNTLITGVWESIARSAERCPPELRQIFKYIRAVSEDRYGDYLRTVAYTSVSAFLFLRFFCPALLNPKLFGLLRDHPQPKAQRTLTLIAKSLQALANLSNFGQKESWMEPMNRFIAGHRQGVKDFLDSVCDIPAERSSGFALPASYSTPITILARLPPTSREGFPSLPYLIDHARNFSSLVKLWLDATSQDIALQGLEGEVLDFHELCLSLHRRTNDCLLKAEEAERGADQLSLQCEDVVETLQSSTIHDVMSLSPRSNREYTQELQPTMESPTWTENSANFIGNRGHSQRLPPGSAGSETGSREKKDRQSFWDLTFRKESKYQKPFDPIADASHASPPSRGQSRNGKQTRSFLSGMKRKGKGSDASTQASAGFNSRTSPGNSWHGTMI